MDPRHERLPLGGPGRLLVDVLGVNAADGDDAAWHWARAKDLLLAKRLHPRGVVLVGHALQFGREARIDGLHEEVVQLLEPGGSLAVVRLVERLLLILRAIPVHDSDLVVRGEPIRAIRAVGPCPVGAVLGWEFLASPTELVFPGVCVVVGLKERILRIALIGLLGARVHPDTERVEHTLEARAHIEAAVVGVLRHDLDVAAAVLRHGVDRRGVDRLDLAQVLGVPNEGRQHLRRLHVRLVVHRLHVRAETRAQHRVPGQRDERRHAVRLEDCPALLLALNVDVLRPLKTLVPEAPQAEAAVVEHVLPQPVLATARRLILALGLQEELVGLPVLFLGRVGRLRHGAPGGDRIGGLSDLGKVVRHCGGWAHGPISSVPLLLPASCSFF